MGGDGGGGGAAERRRESDGRFSVTECARHRHFPPLVQCFAFTNRGLCSCAFPAVLIAFVPDRLLCGVIPLPSPPPPPRDCPTRPRPLSPRFATARFCSPTASPITTSAAALQPPPSSSTGHHIIPNPRLESKRLKEAPPPPPLSHPLLSQLQVRMW